MTARRLAEYALGGLVLVLVGSLLLGQLLGQPVLLAYVETGSMAPTMQPNDGFVALPPGIAGPIEAGDVVTFDARTLQGGGLTTHRVVGQTDAGFITKGDANPVTDQDSGEPVVPPDRIVAVALQVGGDTVVIPQLGLLVTGIGSLLSAVQRQLAVTLGTRAVLGTQGLAYLLFGFGVVAYAISTYAESQGPRRPARSRRRQTGSVNGETLVLVATLLIVGLVTASMIVPAGGESFTIVSSQSDAPGPRVIHQGTSESLTYVVPSNGLLPVIAYFEPTSDGVTIDPDRIHVPGSTTGNVTVTLTAPPSTGSYTRSFVEHRYLALLPGDTIDDLHRLHPWLPILALDLLVGLGFAGISLALVGRGPIRLEDRRGRSLRTRLRRWLR